MAQAADAKHAVSVIHVSNGFQTKDANTTRTAHEKIGTKPTAQRNCPKYLHIAQSPTVDPKPPRAYQRAATLRKNTMLADHRYLITAA